MRRVVGFHGLRAFTGYRFFVFLVFVQVVASATAPPRAQ